MIKGVEIHRLTPFPTVPFPTVAGANVISTGADAAAAWTANQILLHPTEIAFVGETFHQFISPSGPGATWAEITGAVIHTPIVTPWIIPDFGP